MSWISALGHTQAGDLAQLIGPRHKKFLIRLKPGDRFSTNFGSLVLDDLIGQLWGSQVFSLSGVRFFLLQPTLEEVLLSLERKTQIVYPKDIGPILVKLGICPGLRVLEAGTGSGGLTAALAFAVGPGGRVFSYEINPDHQALAISNLASLNLSRQVDFHLGDVKDGFFERSVDAVFLDLPEPEHVLGHVWDSLKPGGVFGCLLPTSNQVSRLLKSLPSNSFEGTEVCETLMRNFKPHPERLRPMDRMVAHTGYLVFARRVLPRSPASPPPHEN